MSEIPTIPEEYLNGYHSALIRIRFSEFFDDNGWDYIRSQGWVHLLTKESYSRKFIDGYSAYGPIDGLMGELTNAVNCFKDKNKRGIGRYSLSVEIYEYEIAPDTLVKQYDIVIDDNRDLDKYIFDVPYNPKKKSKKYNIKE